MYCLVGRINSQRRLCLIHSLPSNLVIFCLKDQRGDFKWLLPTYPLCCLYWSSIPIMVRILPWLILFFFFFFLGLNLWQMKFLGWGSNQSCSSRPIPQPQQHWIRSLSATYTTACSDAGSLTHWARPGIKPTSSWTLCWVRNPLSHNRNSTLSYSFHPGC